jgi:hypothetical protein
MLLDFRPISVVPINLRLKKISVRKHLIEMKKSSSDRVCHSSVLPNREMGDERDANCIDMNDSEHEVQKGSAKNIWGCHFSTM